jgi:hypothetical protein
MDPRVPNIAARYIDLFNKLGTLGKAGFAHMLDTASTDDLTELSDVVDALLRHIERTQRSLAGG